MPADPAHLLGAAPTSRPTTLQSAGALCTALAVNGALVLALVGMNRPTVGAPPPAAPAVRVETERARSALQAVPADPVAPPAEPAPPPEVLVRLDLAIPAPDLKPLDVPQAYEPELELGSLAGDLGVGLPSAPAAPDPTQRRPAAGPTTRGRGSSAGGAGGPYSADGVDVPPRELALEQPAYPRLALRRGLEGRVTVKLLIAATGAVEQADVLEVEGAGAFGEAVLEVARRWRFEPARHEGRAVRVWATKTIAFTLADRR